MGFVIKLTIITLTALLAFSRPITTEAQQNGEQELWAVPGNGFNILTKAPENHVIQFCRWDAIGPNSKTGASGIVLEDDEQDEIPSTMMSVQQEVTHVDGYSYFGAGFSLGECGIKIDIVTDADIGVWKCTTYEYDPNSSSGHSVERYFNLQIAVAPYPPSISDKSTAHLLTDKGHGIQSTFVCCSENGVPDPKLSFIFNGRIIPDSSVRETHSHKKICLTWENAQFVRSDSGKRLKCESNHSETSALGSADTEDYIELDISYGPELLTALTKPENKSIFINLSTGSRKIEIDFSSNPKADVTWYVQEGDDFYRPIQTGQEFQTTTTEVPDKGHSWRAILELKTYDIKESKNVFKLKLENSIGSEEVFVVNIDSHAVEIVPIPGDSKESGFSLYWLIYLSIALVALLIIVTTYIVLAKRNGWLCYRNQVGRYDAEKRGKSIQNEEQNDMQHPEYTENDDRVYNPLVTSAA